MDNLEKLETSGTLDTEGRQNIGQSRDTGNIRNTKTHKLKKQSTTDNLKTLETSGTQDREVRQTKHN